ncbi:hypothetical protein Tco_0409075 [Tanacetum coccineum]
MCTGRYEFIIPVSFFGVFRALPMQEDKGKRRSSLLGCLIRSIVLKSDNNDALSKLLQMGTMAEYHGRILQLWEKPSLEPVSPRPVLRTKNNQAVDNNVGDQEDPNVNDKQEVKKADDQKIENVKDEEGKNVEDQ